MAHDAVSGSDLAPLGPLLLTENRVGRFYRGGALLERFRGSSSPADSHRPEDWVGSITRSWTPAGVPPGDEGLSRVVRDGIERTLLELVEARAEAFIGERLLRIAGPTTALLVKLLDTVERLPVHCHPDRSFARRLLGSPFGKTEAWIVVETREIHGAEPPDVRLGFSRDVAPDELRGWIERQDRRALLAAMHRLDVRPGDAFLVPAGVPHAIGAGVFLVELQEPTDYSVVAETDGFPIDPANAHLGLGWDTMLGCFDGRGIPEGRLAALRPAPETIGETAALTEVRLLGPEADPYFRAFRLTARGAAAMPFGQTFLVGIVTAGRGRVVTPAGRLELARGTTFALPAAISDRAVLEPVETVELLVCLPPDPETLANEL